MRRFLYQAATVLAFTCTVSLGAPDWTPLFNGKDLSGFYTWVDGKGKNQDPNKYFSVDPDSSIHVYANITNGAAVTFGYLATEKEYSHYRLRWQWKWGTKRFAPGTAKRDAGLLYHITGPDQDNWPRCVQLAKDADYEVAGWNDAEIDVHDDSVIYYTNGKFNNRVFKLRQRTSTNPDQFAPLTMGKIGFEAEGNEVFYRKIELMDLTAGATDLGPAFRTGTKKSFRTGKPTTDRPAFDAKGRTSEAFPNELYFPLQRWTR